MGHRRLARDQIHTGTWARLSAWSGLLLLVAILAASTPGLFAQDAEPDPPAVVAYRSVALQAGWNLVGWTGDTDLAEAVRPLSGAFTAVHTWDAGAQTFGFFGDADTPAFLNTAATPVELGDGLWVLVPEAVVWAQPMRLGARTVPLLSGFNLAVWTGPSATPIAEAVATIAEDLSAAFTYDAGVQTFRSYGPRRLPLLNDAITLNFGDALWLLMQNAAQWDQPAPPPPATVTSADGLVTLTIPDGALPAGTDPEDIRITDVSGNPAALTLNGQPATAAYRFEPEGLTFSKPVTLTLPVTMPDGSIPQIFQLADSVEELAVVAAVVDADGEGSVDTVFLEHFSIVAVVHPGFFTVTTSEPGDTMIGETFTWDLVMAAVDQEQTREINYEFEGEPRNVVIVERGPTFYALSGRYRSGDFFSGLTTSHINPMRVEDRPPWTRRGENSVRSFQIGESFTCVQDGRYRLSWSGYLLYGVDRTRTVNGDEVESGPKANQWDVKQETRNTCNGPQLMFRNDYTAANDTNTYSFRLARFDSVTTSFVDYTLDPALVTPTFEVVQMICGETRELPRNGNLFRFTYAHGTGTPGGPCTVPQEDEFKLQLTVTITLPRGNSCVYSEEITRGRTLQGSDEFLTGWNSKPCG